MSQKHHLSSIVSKMAAGILTATHGYFHITNPYARWHIVRQPYTTTVGSDGDIVVRKRFDIRVSDNRLMNLVGYYKSGFLILQHTLRPGRRTAMKSPDEVYDVIHRVRFDPTKPYLISGDQFSVLYIRNLGVFYRALLNPNTARGKRDWENRQRIYLQSALYALDVLSRSRTIKTTAVPIGRHHVAFMAVHLGSTGSDTVYGLLYALYELVTPLQSQDKTYRRQTVQAAKKIIKERHDDLVKIYQRYIDLVADGDVVRQGITLAAARDGAHREQSFYDAVILWKTRQLAMQLGIADETPAKLKASRQRIIGLYWNAERGHFRDELAKPDSYSSDWLIAPAIGFLDHKRDFDKLASCVDYIRAKQLAEPLPIRYTDDAVHAPWAVRTFVSTYGGGAIWSYWGAEYITLLAVLNMARPNKSYQQEARHFIKLWEQVMVRDQGFPETLDQNGQFLQSAFYKSIRTTGWVVQFEYARYVLRLDERK